MKKLQQYGIIYTEGTLNMKIIDILSKSLKNDVPSELKKDFNDELLRKNYNKMSLVCVVFFLVELVIFILPERLFEYKIVILHILIVNVVSIPIIFYISHNFDKVNKFIALIIQDLYLFSLLILAMFMALKSQNTADFVHMYIMAKIAIASFIYLKYLNSLILFGTALFIFSFLLPYYQTNPDTAFIILANTVLFTILAFLLVHIRLKGKVASFLDKKLLEKIAQSDSMTQFYNHETAILMLSDEIKKVNSSAGMLSLIMIDIDNFKQVNDTYGHIQGDKIIKDVAAILRNQKREKDIIGRYGGDEFIIILPDTDINEACNTIKQIFYSLIRKKLPITLSAGVGQYEGEKVNEFVKKTDMKLLKAKQLGKNRFVYE